MLKRLWHFIAENQILIVLAAIIGGILFPEIFNPLSRWSTPFLMAIFFTSSLRLSLHEVSGYAKDWKLLLIANGLMLIFLPLAVWLPSALFAPEWALPFLIVNAMPTGLTIALIADLFGGKPTLALLISATTSLLAPITIPLVLQIAVGRQVAIPTFELFSSLLLTIVAPFILAMLLKSRAKVFIEKHDLAWREISLALFALLVAGIVAKTSKSTPITIQFNEIGIIITMLAVMIGNAWMAYAATSWRSPAERITVALCMVYMNNTLALYIGDRFFKEQNIVPKLLIILTVVNALLPLIKWAASRVIKTEHKIKYRSQLP